jgi:hypothetical protein
VSDRDGTFRYKPRSKKHGVYAFVIDGTLSCAGTLLKRRDSKAVWAADEIVCATGRGDTDVLFVESVL